ncbi:V-set domain-containing T-cell activation inhibitor 1 [Bombina bombina]|uniref:V-set domain-containing T-cell activation inhibitor 1 n=1 Tax=Bombina bombina TaxID=8345 RepID=UPI00235A78F9|nr:V-set domain-containing T-cell activation inhibitor 1 [Bombina bombina]XP_053572331.1 V-set domain-containing T-cell activation inhibitor 1 [Bombina bombina]
MLYLTHVVWILLSTVLLIPGCNSELITGILQEEVLLPCVVTYEEDFSYDDLVVLWNHEEFNVHHFFEGKFQADHQAKQFQGRTQLFPKEFLKGNLSLLLKDLRLSDAGSYTCNGHLTKLTRYSFREIELVIQARYGNECNESSALIPSLTIAFGCLVIFILIVLFRRKKRSRGTEGMTPKDQSPKGKKE